ncbi:hypothetical protein J4573_02450 [Actinomadura barringtoniae]|uniref:Uncharacterized protein n=1 Tax=Actinomadura barringtoniae TaxID=1427535 RepID=A0A939P625_9ACTN|nr:hypothetical protein [Actinomadura barringtoniae]MBO2445940.1 hypothetical protein [Actinomadura barringtoniae]
MADEQRPGRAAGNEAGQERAVPASHQTWALEVCAHPLLLGQHDLVVPSLGGETGLQLRERAILVAELASCLVEVVLRLLQPASENLRTLFPVLD